MKTLLGVIVVLFAAGIARAEDVFRVEFLNGTAVSGTISDPIKIQTKYGTLTMPVADLTYVRIGLNNRPDLAEAIDTDVNALKSPDEATRTKAQNALIERGPAIRPVLEAYLSRGIDEKQKALIASIVQSLAAKGAAMPTLVLIQPTQPSSVGGEQATVAGTVLNTSFTIKTAYAEFTATPADIDKITRVAALPKFSPVGADIVRVSVQLADGSVLVGDTSGSITIKVFGTQVDVPMKTIAAIVSSPAGTQVTLMNRDRLAGTVLTKEIGVKTLVGELTVPLTEVRNLAPTLRRGLMALWSGEGNAEDGAGSFNGQISGSVAFVPGKVGQAFQFNGSSYVNFGNVAPGNLTGDMTLSMWIKPDRLGIRQNPWNKYYTADGALTLEPDGRLVYYFGPPPPGQREGGSSPHVWPGTPPKEDLVKANEWTHVVIVRISKTKEINWYINGRHIAAAFTLFTGSVSPSSSSLLLGTGYAGAFYGAIDEVAVWDRPLSDNEVKRLYELQNAGNGF